MGADGDLLVGGDDALHQGGMLGGRDFTIARQAAEVVYTFEDNNPAHARRREHIAIEACQSAWAEAIVQQVVASNTLVGYADVLRCRRSLQARRKPISPAIVAVGRGAV